MTEFQHNMGRSALNANQTMCEI